MEMDKFGYAVILEGNQRKEIKLRRIIVIPLFVWVQSSARLLIGIEYW